MYLQIRNSGEEFRLFFFPATTSNYFCCNHPSTTSNSWLQTKFSRGSSTFKSFQISESTIDSQKKVYNVVAKKEGILDQQKACNFGQVFRRPSNDFCSAHNLAHVPPIPSMQSWLKWRSLVPGFSGRQEIITVVISSWYSLPSSKQFLPPKLSFPNTFRPSLGLAFDWFSMATKKTDPWGCEPKMSIETGGGGGNAMILWRKSCIKWYGIVYIYIPWHPNISMVYMCLIVRAEFSSKRIETMCTCWNLFANH